MSQSSFTLHNRRWWICSVSLALLLVLMTAGTALAVDTIVVVTPADLGTDNGEWHPANQRHGGISQITATQPDQHGGAGSLEQYLPGPEDAPPDTAGVFPKTDFQIVDLAGFGLLADVDALGFDWFRDSSSTAPGHFTPVLRLIVYDPVSEDSYLLIWEGVYNGYPSGGPAVPVDTWVAEDILAGNFWRVPQFIDGVFRGIGSCVEGNMDPADPTSCFVYDRGLGEWGLSPETLVVGIEVGVGSGWNGSYLSFADYVRIGFNGDTTIYDFEPVAQEEPEGFVTGGGWFLDPNAPEGTKNPKVTFGFNAMVKPNSTDLHGVVQVNVHTTKLNFHANTINVLDVDLAAGTAYIEGWGRIKYPGGPKNGPTASPKEIEAGFRMWIEEGDPDQVRLQIYTLDGETESIVYDTGDLVALGGGNITLHSEAATQEDVEQAEERVEVLIAQAELDAGTGSTLQTPQAFIPVLASQD